MSLWHCYHVCRSPYNVYSLMVCVPVVSGNIWGGVFIYAGNLRA